MLAVITIALLAVIGSIKTNLSSRNLENTFVPISKEVENVIRQYNREFSNSTGFVEHILRNPETLDHYIPTITKLIEFLQSIKFIHDHQTVLLSVGSTFVGLQVCVCVCVQNSPFILRLDNDLSNKFIHFRWLAQHSLDSFILSAVRQIESGPSSRHFNKSRMRKLY